MPSSEISSLIDQLLVKINIQTQNNLFYGQTVKCIHNKVELHIYQLCFQPQAFGKINKSFWQQIVYNTDLHKS